MTIAGGLYLPQVDFTARNSAIGAIVAPQETLNATATPASQQQLQCAAINTVIPVTYGRDRLGARLADPGIYQSHLVMFVVWGYGPYDGLESFTVDDAAPVAGVIATHYDGTQVAPDPVLAAIYGAGYSDVLANIVYSVVRFPVGTTSGMPQLAALWRGRKLYDPRSGLTVWSDNPSLALADFEASTVYGEGKTVDWDSVGVAADANDELVAGVKRRTFGLTLDTRQECKAWRDTLRTYAGCWVLDTGAGVRLIPDRPAEPVADFLHASGQILELEPLELRDIDQVPTVMEIVWTDTSQLPWREAVATAEVAGVSTGARDVRLSAVALPGIRNASQAQREAIERLNALTTADLSTALRTADDGMVIEPGDVIRVSHPVGLTLKKFRVNGVSGSLGNYRFALDEYDPARYSNAVVSGSTTPDTELPHPETPAAPASITVTEELFRPANRIVVSRLRASWPAVDLPWAHHYRCEFWRGSVLASQSVSDGLEAVSDQVEEGVLYTVRVATVVPFVGAASAWRSTTITPAGKDLAPTNVADLDGFEVGGEVRLYWPAAIDIDLEGYEVRWGVAAVAWADATVLDRLNALRLVTKEIPAGTWDFLVCAYDSRRDEQGLPNYSPTPARKTITVTLDAAAFLVDRFDFTTPTLVGMTEYRLAPDDSRRYFITEDGATVASKFTGDLSAYTEPMSTYHAAQTSRLTTDAADFGQILAGNWQGTASNADAISGAIADFIELSDTLAAWTSTAGLVVKASGRFSRLKFEGSGADTIRVALPDLSVRLDAVPRTEVGVATSLSSGPVTVTLEQVFTAFKGRPKITPTGNAPRTYTVDNLVVGNPTSFDVNIWDSADARVVNEFGYEANGV